jgi:hypothetical protein
VKTTVEIPDALYRQLKSAAALRGSSVRELIVRGLEQQLKAERDGKKDIKLPIIESKKPGRLRLTNRTIHEILFP